MGAKHFQHRFSNPFVTAQEPDMDPDFPMTAKDLIHSLRGGPPENGDFIKWGTKGERVDF